MGYYFKIKAKYFLLVFPVLLTLFFAKDYIQYVSILSGAFFLYRYFSFLDRFGEEIMFLDLIELLVIMQWVLSPAIYYCIEEYDLIQWHWWYWKMKVPANEYFSLAIPSSIGFLLGLRIYSAKTRINNSVLQQLKRSDNLKTGIILIVISIIVRTVGPFIPSSLQYVSTLFSNFFFIGFLYIYYSNAKFKKLILAALFIYIVYNGLAGGMFGEIIWWPLFILMIVLLGRKTNFNLKLGITICGFLAFTVLQSVKSKYRIITWKGTNSEYASSRIDLLNSLVQQQVAQQNSGFFSLESLYPIIGRLNQGLHVARAMNYTPSREPYAYGETIGTAIGATIVPRFLWPDKPEAGGRANYKRFTGATLKSASMNIGQIGDAYVNFTIYGAPFLLFLYGLLLSSFLKFCIDFTQKYPRLLFWLPFLFVSLITVESDFLSTVNALFKSSIFLFILFKINKKVFV